MLSGIKTQGVSGMGRRAHYPWKSEESVFDEALTEFTRVVFRATRRACDLYAANRQSFQRTESRK